MHKINFKLKMNVTIWQQSFSHSATAVSSNAIFYSLYLFLSTSGFLPLLASLIGIRVLIASIGIVLNLGLVLVTIFNRNLHGSTNILIAIDSFSLIIYQLGFFPMWIIVLMGKNLVPLHQCFWPMLLPVFAKNFSSALMLAIGLDRLKIVVFARRSSNLTAFFVLLWTILSAILGFVVISISYRVMLRIPNSLVMCAASEITQQEAAYISFYSNFALNCMSPIVYCVLAYVLHLIRQKSNGSTGSGTSLYRSIFVLMLVQLVGWTSNSLSVLLLDKLFTIASLSDLTKWSINCVFSYVLIFATAINGPILYFCSSEYKKTIRAQFGRLYRKMFNNNNNNPWAVIKVQPQQQLQIGQIIPTKMCRERPIEKGKATEVFKL